MGLVAAKKVHNLMIDNVLNASINLFYDVTPIGTIMNRFSNDLDELDRNVF